MPSPQQSEEFWRDCGLRPALTVDVEREGLPDAQRHVVDLPFALLGRDERNRLCLPDSQVSRRHAYLQALAGGVFCIDLGSRTGSCWNDEPRPAGWVGLGDCLQIGPFTLRLGGETGPAEGAGSFDPLAADGAPPASSWALELPGGLRWRINRPLTLVGKSSRCKLRPNSPEASRFHCGLVRAPQGVWVVDLLSSHGTHVNGERIAWSLLEEGGELRIGRVVLRLRREGPDSGVVSVGLGDGAGAPLLSPAEPSPRAGAQNDEPSPAVPPDAEYTLLPLQAGGGRSLPAVDAVRVPALSRSSPAELQEVLLGPVINQFSLMQQQMLEQFHQTMVMMAQAFGNLHRDQMSLIRDELNQLHRVTQELQILHVELARRPPPPVAVPAERGYAPPPASAPPEPQQEKGAGQRPGGPPPAGGEADAIHALLRQRLAALEEERKGRWDKILRFMLGR